MDDPSILQDSFLSDYQIRKQYHCDVKADPEVVIRTLTQLDLRGSWWINLLLMIRGIHLSTMTMPGMTEMGFVHLSSSNTGFIMGLIGKFWTPSGDLKQFEANQFIAFDIPGFAKATWSFEVKKINDATSRVITETRVKCTDARSTRKFKFYWKLIGPFSGIIRKEILRELRKKLIDEKNNNQ